MKKEPLISVIIPNYNYAHFLPQCIDSVINQTYKNWELIVADDNSTDDSREIVTNYIKKYPELPIRLLHNHDGPAGTSVPINMGINQMKGEYFAWLSSDDMFLPEKLEKQVEILINNPGVGMVHTRTSIIDDDNNIVGTNRFIAPPSRADFFLALMKMNFINGNTVVIRKEILEKVGLFIEKSTKHSDIWRAADYLAWLKIILESEIVGINEKLSLTRKHRGNADYNISGFGEKLRGLLFALVIQERDIFDLSATLDVPEQDRARFEAEIRRELAVCQYSHLVLERHLHLQKKDPDLEEKILEKMARLTKAQYLIKNADIYLKHKPHTASILLKQALELDDRSDIRSLYTLASMEKRKGNAPEAESLFNEVLEKDFCLDSPFVTGAWFHLGEIRLARGDRSGAEQDFSACLRENPDHGKAAEYLKSLGKAVEIRDYWDKGAATMPYRVIADLDTRQEFQISGVADVNMILKHIKKDKTGITLDVGCGMGRLMRPMSYAAAKIIGVDASLVMIDKAHTYLEDIPNKELYHIQNERTSFEAGTFDFAYSIVVFMHLPRFKFEAWVKEIHRILAPDGIFWFQVYGDFGPGKVLPQESEEISSGGRAYSREDLKEITRNYFKEVEIFKDNTDRYEGKHWYYCICRGWHPHPIGASRH
jgi:glycosyltransferase involved in cell wall biosynthesis/SAM-dependent methyltransferase